jgi:peptidoglycan/LPS O-acetylase OafA/YrhL
VQDGILISGAGYYNSALWSLRWEVLFSLLLPAYIYFARSMAKYWLPIGVLLLATTAVGQVAHVDYLQYLPMFGVGVLMAANRESLMAFSGRLASGQWAGLAVGGLILMVGAWLLPDLPGNSALPVVGAGIVVLLFLGQRNAVGLGNSLPVYWLGRRSFSFYLVHEPIVVSVAVALHTTQVWLVLIVALPCTLIAATAFYRLVERPSHKLANAIGKSVERRHPRRGSAC